MTPLLLLWLFSSAAVPNGTRLAAQSPQVAATLPIYPGAERYDPEATPFAKSVNETLLGLPGAWPLVSSSTETYIVEVATEKVATYYRTTLRAVASDFPKWSAVDPRTLAPGHSTPVHYQSYMESGAITHVYHWYRREPNDDIDLSEVAASWIWYVADPRLAGRKGPLTRIDVTRKTFSKTAPSSAPDVKTLGAPIYPGSVYDSQASTITGGVLSSHVFLTNDAVDAVVRFYEASLGRTAMKGEPPDGGITWFFQSYSSSSPEDALFVTDASGSTGSHKTMILFRLNRIE